NLRDVTAHSVGQVRVDGLLATYFGTQCETANHAGAVVYGGSDLFIVRGDYDALLEYRIASEVRLAIAQARAFGAATEEFPGLCASRGNYDVAQGVDAGGRGCSGVLEQSWRIGGASGPEVAALLAFRDDPTLRAVRARCIEVYGASPDPPQGAIV